MAIKKFEIRLIIIGLCTVILSSCGGSADQSEKWRLLEDAAGREVRVPETIESVVALRSGALRLLCYMDLADRVKYIEGNETRRNVPYLMAFPALREKELIGAGNNYDTELLAASDADLIVVTYMSSAEADKLQKNACKPVVVLEYGDLNDHMEDLFGSLEFLGEVFNRRGRSDSVVHFIKESIRDFNERSSAGKSISAYIGGIAYSGAHGISSTKPDYPPYRLLSVENVAATLAERLSLPLNKPENILIDLEQLLIWNPDYIFLDAAGEKIWKQEIEKFLPGETLASFRSGQVYSVLPFNWFTTNYENVLCNTWFIGKILYPEAFQDVDLEAKCREIYAFFLGTDVYDEMVELYKPFVQIAKGGYGE